MANYTLEYFKVRGRGAAIRYLLNDNGIAYTEVDVCPGMNVTVWTEKFKPQMPFGQAPLLRDGDFELAQSNAILRYLGRNHGLVGSNAKEMAKADMINDSIEDMRVAYTTLIYENYDKGKETFVKALPDKLRPFEKLLAKWGNTFVLEQITFVDYNLFDLLDILLTLAPGCLGDFPTLTKYHNTMLSRPGIKAYRSSEDYKNMPINGNGKQ